MLHSAALRVVVIATITLALGGCGKGGDGPTIATVDPVPPLLLQPPAAKLPLLNIATANGTAIISRTTYVNATITLSDSTGTRVLEAATEVRGRGNTTWDMPKKPYRIRLAVSTPLLGMPANRHWVLLANYSDKTLLRNDLTLDFSRMVGLAWTPRSRFVDVQLNGQYAGVYQLVEHIRVGTERVNITAMKASDTTAATISGGYLLEVDERRGETFCFNSTMTRMVFCAADPETLLDAGWEKQRAYLTSYIARTDSAIFGNQFADTSRGYAAYIDVESAINYNIIQEVVKNVDGNLRFSTYLYKPRNGKLFFGPAWDFDLAIGNVNYNEADRVDGWYSRRSQWYTRLFQDPAFAARFKARYAELKRAGVLDSLQRRVFQRANYLNVVQKRNFERWPILGIWVWPNRVVTGSYDGETIALNLWLMDRLRWIDAEVSR